MKLVGITEREVKQGMARGLIADSIGLSGSDVRVIIYGFMSSVVLTSEHI